MINRKLYAAIKITFIYFLGGFIWILSSDTILKILIPERDQYAELQTYKGWIFILISSLLLFFLLYRELKRRDIIEADLNKNLKEKRILLNEIHHRVKNNLNSIISLLYLENSNAESPDSKKIIQTLSGRIYSMALVHEKLYQSKNFSGIRLKDYIPELCSHIISSFPDIKDKVKTYYYIDESFLDIIKGIPFGILINEIINNSCRHAFPGTENGTISINISNKEYNLLVTVEDNGIGFNASEENTNDTQGFELISLLVNQLAGTITRTSVNGLKYHITFPVESSNG